MKLFLGITLVVLALLVGYCSMDGEPEEPTDTKSIIAVCRLDARQDCLDSLEYFCKEGYDITEEYKFIAPSLTWKLYKIEAVCK
jgi:hypothetical protein